MADQPASIIFQSAKLGDRAHILKELEWARIRLTVQKQIDRIYGMSGGAFVALAFALALAAERDPTNFGAARAALNDFAAFLDRAPQRAIRRLNPNPWYGFYRLNPLRRWLAGWLEAHCGDPQLTLAQLPLSLYLCAGDRDGTLTLFGPVDAQLQFEYTWINIGPPQNAPIVDAVIAAMSTVSSIEPAQVNGRLYRDCRPAITDARAIVADLEANSPRPIWVHSPHTPPPPWKLNWITSTFIMHRHHEHNQAQLARYYTDLLERQRKLEWTYRDKQGALNPLPESASSEASVRVKHIDLPYVGSTEAFTNMRQSVATKEALMTRFESLLAGQFEGFRFDQPTQIIYGAGGFSGILAGLVTTRRVDAGFEKHTGHIRQIYGVSAGVLNGFFHAIQIAARSHPALYMPAAHDALSDLERFFEDIHPRKIASINLLPHHFWQGWANLDPLEQFLLERLSVYTGSSDAEELTFDDIQLPLTISVARDDGLADFLGMTKPERAMRFAGSEVKVLAAPIVKAIIAGWSMNTYIRPTRLGDQTYRDGGGSFYDPALFVACLDPQLNNLLNIHLDEPEGHSYHLPERPNLLRLLFDTHNYNFPEQRRRMRLITDLLYKHFALRHQAELAGVPLAADFRQAWDLPDPPLTQIFGERHTFENKELK